MFHEQRIAGIELPAVDILRPAAVRGETDIGVAHKVILQIHYGRSTAYEQDAVPVVQHANLIRGQKLSAGALRICGIAAGLAVGLAVGTGQDGGLAQHLGYELVGTAFVAAEVQDAVGVAEDGFPTILI